MYIRSGKGNWIFGKTNKLIQFWVKIDFISAQSCSFVAILFIYVLFAVSDWWCYDATNWTRIAKNYKLGINYTNSQFDFDRDSDPSFSVGFNTPEHKLNISLGNQKLFDNFGFNVNFRWSDEYFWQSSLANAIMPSRTVVDAQLNYSVPSIKSLFKIGATNLGGKEFQSAVGTGFIGSQYFVSWTINN